MLDATTGTPQAPAGGAVSPVNGQFYEGGEFMPTTGLACGLKRAARRAAAMDAGCNWAEIIGERCASGHYLISYRPAGSDRSRWAVRTAIPDGPTAAAVMAEILAIRAAANRARGLAPHPTAVRWA